MVNKAELPLISVILPAYNVEAYLDECMESLLAQSYERLELLLVDDGSTDDTPALCDAWGQRDLRVRVLHKSNGGLSDARNVGLQEAKGDYVAFIDPDDYVDPGMYEVLYGLCRQYDTRISCIRFDAFGVDAGMDIPPESGESARLTATEYLSKIITYDEQMPSSYSVCIRLYERRVLEGLFFPKNIHYEDIVYSTKAVLRAGAVAYQNAFYYHYRVREDSISHQQDREKQQRALIRDRVGQRAVQVRYLQEQGEDQLQLVARSVYYPELKRLAAANELHEYDGMIDETLREWRLSAAEIRRLPYGMVRKCKVWLRQF